MPFGLQTPRMKERHHTKMRLQPLAQDNIITRPKPPKKRKRDETETDVLVTEDQKERKRRKKEGKAKQRPLEQDIQPRSPVQELGPAIRDTVRGEDKKVKNQKDGRNVEELLTEATAIQGTEPEKTKKKKKRKKQMTSDQTGGEVQVRPIQEPANGTNKGKNRRKKVKPVGPSAESAKNGATKPSPDDRHDQDDEREVEDVLKLSGSPDLDVLGTTRDPTDEDTLRVAEVGPSKSARGVIISSAGPARRRTTRGDGKRRASRATSVGFGPEAQLASKWLSSAQVRQLEKDTGIVVKKGKFTTSEEVAVRDALDWFREANGLSHERVVEIIHSGQRIEYKGFWHDLTASVPLRPMAAVYSYCKRVYHPLSRQGKWTEEEDGNLLAAVDEIGHRWEEVSTRVGRSASDCRDRYKNHLSERNTRNTGAWTEAEEEELVRIVQEVQEDQRKDDDDDGILWSIVSARMGGRRGKQQVRDKWLNQLRSRVQNEIEKVIWTDNDSVILLRRLASLNLEDESEINWNALSDGNWNLWSPHILQRHWVSLKKSVKNHEDRTFSEILKMVNVKLFGRKKATRSMKGTQEEDKKELTRSKNIIEDSDEELARPNDSDKTAHGGPVA